MSAAFRCKHTVAGQYEKLVVFCDIMYGYIRVRRNDLFVGGERIVLFELKVAQGSGEGEVS
jgi:hypothetical protein